MLTIRDMIRRTTNTKVPSRPGGPTGAQQEWTAQQRNPDCSRAGVSPRPSSRRSTPHRSRASTASSPVGLAAALAEDLTAQVFVEAWAGRDRYDENHGGSVGWVFGIATNLLRRHHRQEATQLRAFARVGVDPTDTFDEDAVVDRIMVRDGWKRVAAALSDLSDIDRDILTLAGWAKLSYDDIASALELPIGTVKSRLSRARTQLARRLASAIDLT